VGTYERAARWRLHHNTGSMALRFRIVSIWLRCFWRELRLEISDLAREVSDRGERMSPFGFWRRTTPWGVHRGAHRQTAEFPLVSGFASLTFPLSPMKGIRAARALNRAAPNGIVPLLAEFHLQKRQCWEGS
jgi:hypothetical protein